MNDHLLSRGEFNVTVISRKDNTIVIGYHPNLNPRQVDGDRLRQLLESKYNLFHALNLPIFFKQNNQYLLIARRWILDYIIDQKIDQIFIIYFENEERIPDVLELDELESRLLPKKRLQVKSHQKEKTPSKHQHTNDRRRAKKSGRICPFCQGPLFEEQKKRSDTPDGFHRITCDNKTNKFYDNCPFTALLTNYELKRFNAFELKTEEWLKPVPESILKCGKIKYLRIRNHGKGPKERLHLCENYFRSPNGICDYRG